MERLIKSAARRREVARLDERLGRLCLLPGNDRVAAEIREIAGRPFELGDYRSRPC